jgi:hypothetical protein
MLRMCLVVITRTTRLGNAATLFGAAVIAALAALVVPSVARSRDRTR